MLKATVSYVKCSNDKILSFASKFYRENGSMKRKTMTNAKDLKIARGFVYITGQRRSKREHISGCLLCKKTLQFNNNLDGPPDANPNQGWLSNIKSRQGIQALEIQGTSFTIDATAAENFKEAFLACFGRRVLFTR